MSMPAQSGNALQELATVQAARAGALRPRFVLRMAVGLMFVSTVFLCHFGVQLSPTYSANLSLIALYLLLLALVLSKSVTVDLLAATFYFSLICVALVSMVANSGKYISIDSFFLLATIYFPFIFQLKPRPQSSVLYEYALRSFGGMAFVLAICAIVQFFFQFVPGLWLFDIGELIPDAIRAQGVWNTRIPVGTAFFKANGYFQLEPSGLSLLLGFAFLIEVTHLRRYWRLSVIGLGLILSYSGSGIAVLLVGLLFPTRVSALPRAIILALVFLLCWFVLGDVLDLGFLVSRMGEFNDPSSSGYARFIAPAGLVSSSIGSSFVTAVVGNGPGTIQLMIRAAASLYPIHDPTWAKLLVEYGLFGFVLACALVLRLMYRKEANLELKLALLYAWLASGGQLLQPSFAVLLIGLVGLSPRRTRASAVPATDPRPNLAKG